MSAMDERHPAGKGHTLLVVDDDAAIRFALRDFFSVQGCRVVEADSLAAATRVFQEESPDATVLDYQLPDGEAIDVLPRLRVISADTPIVILTAHATIERAVKAIQLGANQFLTKPVDLPVLHAVLDRLCETRMVLRKERASDARVERGEPDPFLGESPGIRALRDEANRALESDSPVVILGETGCGKGVLAHWIHRHGRRSGAAFVDINCAGLSRDLLESELFGYEKGAFTGAVAAKPGLLEVAHRGSVFLDEVGDMDLSVQAKLLKVLDDRKFRRLGDVHDRRVDVRVIAATHRDLHSRIGDGSFREDLYYRLSVLVLHVPALRDRAMDIPLIADRLLTRLSTEMGREPVRLSPAAHAALADRPWPGNIRELRNALERAALRARGATIEPADLRFDSRSVETREAGEALSLEDMERRLITRALEVEEGHVERAARRLGIGRSTLYEKLKALGISPP